MRSLGLSFIKSVATSFRATNLLGFRSLASILVETSMVMTISIPLVVLVWGEISSVLGLARATIIAARANNLVIKSNGFNFGRRLFVGNPFMLDILKEAFCSFLLKKYHSIATGSKRSSQKNCGFAKEIFSNIYKVVFTSTEFNIRSTIRSAYVSSANHVRITFC